MVKNRFLGLLLLLVTGAAMATEEPAYTVLEQSGNFELRRYDPMIVAETLVSGSMDDASRSGFRLIADYIFGNNTLRNGGKGKISMTAPVTMAVDSEEISMTAPVSMQRSSGKWRMHFVMPSEYTLDSLPRPNNPAVKLREIPATDYAVIRFSGLAGENKVAAKTAELEVWLEGRGIEPRGNPELARYNPPWTLPFLRRNEVMIPYRPG
ncbi:MAG: heme-binding protein [Sedimenticolaceae bacterium]